MFSLNLHLLNASEDSWAKQKTGRRYLLAHITKKKSKNSTIQLTPGSIFYYTSFILWSASPECNKAATSNFVWLAYLLRHSITVIIIVPCRHRCHHHLVGGGGVWTNQYEKVWCSNGFLLFVISLCYLLQQQSIWQASKISIRIEMTLSKLKMFLF